ncbi:MAG: hypothetical protein AB1503_04655 [Bacillota bacterium]|nr:hypothetical protein [Bacillota bacterium]
MESGEPRPGERPAAGEPEVVPGEAAPVGAPEPRAAGPARERRMGWRDWALLFLIFLVGMISARACRGG